MELKNSLSAHQINRWLVLFFFNAFLFGLFLFNRNWGLGLLFFELGHLLPHLALHQKKQPLTLVKITATLLLSLFFFIRQNFASLASIPLLMVLNMMVIYELETGLKFPFSRIKRLPFLAINTTKFLFIHTRYRLLSFTRRFSGEKLTTDSQNLEKIAKGVIISAPIVLVLLVLFRGADPEFGYTFLLTLQKILPNWSFDFTLLIKFIVEFSLFSLYLGVVFPILSDQIKQKNNTSLLIEKITINFVIATIFVLFASTQIESFRSIIFGFQTGNINPRLFVREGFYQLLIASLIGTGAVYLLDSELLPSITSKVKKIAYLGATSLLGSVAFVSILAGQRLWVYQFLHGLTVLRVWGVALLVAFWLGLAILLIRLYRFFSQNMMLQLWVLVSVVIVITLQILNIQLLVAKWKPPQVSGETDWSYIGYLSYDAVPVWNQKVGTITVEDLGLCAPQYDEQGNPVTVSAPEADCIQLFEDLADENALIASLLNNKLGYHYSRTKSGEIIESEFIIKSGKRVSIEKFCSSDNKHSLRSLNLSVLNGESFICDHTDQWRQFHKTYYDLGFLVNIWLHAKG